MKRVGSQLILCSNLNTFRNTIIEQNDLSVIKRFISLENESTESAQTIFYNGIISSEIVSVTQHLDISGNSFVLRAFNYVNLSQINNEKIPVTPDKPLLIDFHTTDLLQIKIILQKSILILSNYSINEIITACTSTPSVILKLNNQLKVNHTTKLILWEGIDFFSKKLTADINLKVI